MYDAVQAMLVPLCKPEQLKKGLFQINLWPTLKNESYVASVASFSGIPKKSIYTSAVRQPPGGTNP